MLLDLTEVATSYAIIHLAFLSIFQLSNREFFSYILNNNFLIVFHSVLFILSLLGSEDPPIQPAERGDGAEDTAHKSPSAGQVSTCFAYLRLTYKPFKKPLALNICFDNVSIVGTQCCLIVVVKSWFSPDDKNGLQVHTCTQSQKTQE